jgi:hypothetical protein
MPSPKALLGKSIVPLPAWGRQGPYGIEIECLKALPKLCELNGQLAQPSIVDIGLGHDWSRER